MENKIQTIRESLDAYRTRIASEGFDENSQLNQRYYPYDNHGFALKAGSDIVKKVLEESGKFKFNKEIIKPSHNLHIYSWDYLATDAVILANCTDKGGEDRNGFCDRYDLDPKIWTPMTLHPYQSSLLGDMSADKDSAARAKLGKNSTFLGAIETLDALLSVAEKYKIPMVTVHKNVRLAHPLVRYAPALNQGK